MKQYYYVYKLTDYRTNEYYIGSRGCKCKPENDPYMGSITAWKIDKKYLIKKILKSDFKSRKDAFEYEIELLKKVINDDLNRNAHIPTIGFQVFGLNTYIDSNGVKVSAKKNDDILKTSDFRLIWVGRKHKESSKEKMRQAKLGVKRKKWVREKLSKSHKGKIISNTHKENLAKSKMGKKNPMYKKGGRLHPRARPILQYDLNDNLIKEWGSISEVVSDLNIAQSGISLCLSGKRNKAGGFKWKRK